VSRTKKILFATILVAGVLGFTEAAFSVYYYLVVPEEERDVVETALGLRRSNVHTAIRFVPHPYFNYVCNPDFVFPSGHAPHNSWGFRLPEWPPAKPLDVLRVVAVGGSTTYGMHFERGDDVWPAVVERELQARHGPGIEVYNLGVPGYTPHEVIGVVAMLAPVLEPDIVLVHLGANNAYTACYPNEGGADNTSFRFSWTNRPVPTVTRVWMRWSYLARVLGTRAMTAGGYLPGDLARTMQYSHPTDDEVARNAATATGRHFRQSLRAVLALVGEIGAVPVLVNQPLSPQWDHPEDPFYSVVVNAHRRNNRILAELAAERGLVHIDLYSRCRDPRLFHDAVHASQAGMRAKGVLVADALEPMVLQRQQ